MSFSAFFFFNDTATTEIYTLSLHDALPIYEDPVRQIVVVGVRVVQEPAFLDDEATGVGAQPSGVPASRPAAGGFRDRKSTRLNSSHSQISYAVFCLKKKKT